MFSKKITVVNIALTVAGTVGWSVYMANLNSSVAEPLLRMVDAQECDIEKAFDINLIFIFPMGFLALGFLFTLLFLLSNWFYCSPYCLSPPEEIAVYDPNHSDIKLLLDSVLDSHTNNIICTV